MEARRRPARARVRQDQGRRVSRVTSAKRPGRTGSRFESLIRVARSLWRLIVSWRPVDDGSPVPVSTVASHSLAFWSSAARSGRWDRGERSRSKAMTTERAVGGSAGSEDETGGEAGSAGSQTAIAVRSPAVARGLQRGSSSRAEIVAGRPSSETPARIGWSAVMRLMRRWPWDPASAGESPPAGRASGGSRNRLGRAMRPAGAVRWKMATSAESGSVAESRSPGVTAGVPVAVSPSVSSVSECTATTLTEGSASKALATAESSKEARLRV